VASILESEHWAHLTDTKSYCMKL